MTGGTLFCTLCAVTIESVDEQGVPSRPLEWYEEVRTVSKDFGLSGVGFVKDYSQFHGPLDPLCRYDDATAQQGILSLLVAGDEGRLSFPFHAACWELGLQLFDHPRSDSRLAEIFCNWHHCTTWPKLRYLDPGHDYGGAAKFRCPVGNLIHDMAAAGYRYLTTSPLKHTVDLDRLADGAVIPQQVFSWPLAEFDRPQHGDRFRRLPVEVVHHLLAYLSLTDIRAAVNASSWIAHCSAPAVLPQHFWKSRFGKGFELNFAFAEILGPNCDWRHLYMSVQNAVGYPKQFPSLANRKRIWELLETNFSIFQLHLSEIPLSGKAANWCEPSSATSSDHSYVPGRLSKLISAETTNGPHKRCPGDFLRVGCRELYVRSMRRPAKASQNFGVGVSVVSLNGRCYVSGLRILLSEAGCGRTSDFSIGFVADSLETIVYVAEGQLLKGFEVAVSVHGIKALRPTLADASPESGWIGNIDDEDVSFGFISPTEADGSFTYAAGFDVSKRDIVVWASHFTAQEAEQIEQEFKMVSIGLFETQHEQPCGPDTETRSEISAALIDLWRPYPPGSHISLIHSQIPDNQTYRSMLNLDFGGPNGARLKDLTRIIAHVENAATFIAGFTFEYMQSPSVTYGRPGALEVTSLVDGPAGERIICAVVEYKTGGHINPLASIRLGTNFGKWSSFAADEMRYDLSPPLHKRHGGIGQRPPGRCYKLKAPGEQAIVGFTAFLSAVNGSFNAFGVQCEPTHDAPCSLVSTHDAPCSLVSHPPTELPTIPSQTAVACDLLGCEITSDRSGCKIYTAGSLEGVKKISISRGNESRDVSRDRSTVSGMRLEYYGEKSAAVLGQWVSEFDFVKLYAAEELAEVRMWLKNSHLYTLRTTYSGPVVKITVSTSAGRSKSFQATNDLSDCTAISFRANRYEKLSEFLWVFSTKADHPRVRYAPVSATESTTPVLYQPDKRRHPEPWLVSEKILWEEVSPSGGQELDPVIRISGYAQLVNGKSRAGLLFEYRSGSRRTIGDITVQKQNTLHLQRKEKIIAVDIVYYCRSTMSAEFILCNDDAVNPENGEVESRRVGLFDLGQEVTDPNPRRLERFDLANGTVGAFMVTPNGEVAETLSHDQLPSGPVIGFWGSVDGLGSVCTFSTIHSGNDDGESVGAIRGLQTSNIPR